MDSQLPGPGAGRKPFPTLRRPSSISKSATPPTPPERPTPQRTVEEKFFISTSYSTIAARALSFQGQVLNGVTPLQLAQNGFHYKPYPRFGGLACCFACQSFKRLDSFQSAPFRETQQLHVDNCIWEVIYSEIKQHLEHTTSLDISTNVSPLPRQSTPSHHPTECEPLKKTTTDASTQTPTQSTPAAPAIGENSPNTNLDSFTQSPSATTDLEPQIAPPTYSPQPPQPIPPNTSPQNQHTTYASVLRQSVASTPGSIPSTQKSITLAKPAKSVLTIEDLHRRFHNKPSPFQLEDKPKQRATRRIRIKTTSATQSLSKFLASALPAFSRFLTEMQPKSDACCPSHRNSTIAAP
ncbi:uncharacterized protein N7458_004660 [Penicillium daleae]|jgi:hypothetical protein|uniref:Uncharacterized protein n=1 Tax=Penicillium daleae TaxID=63821 RepID=A0AAD6C6Y4_9EURO|nr:uncharacterized protein N7458_004660 [Penicillium daleae]KAJ5453704.1 hypothetical protein N7458_004660 [Penicillium daleae]